MANKHMKRYLTSWVIREMQIKAKIWDTSIHPLEGLERKKDSYTADGDAKLCCHFGKSLEVSYKIKLALPIWPSTSRNLPEGNGRVCQYEDLRANFIIAWFVQVPKWKQPKYPSTGEWINKLWYIHTTDWIYSAIKRNKLWCTQEHGQISRTCWVKEARHKNQYTIRFHLYEVRNREMQSVGVGVDVYGGEGCWHGRGMREPLGHWATGCTNTGTLVELQTHFTRLSVCMWLHNEV